MHHADEQRMMFLHGLEGSSQGFKARLLRHHFPHIITPDFSGSLEQRMAQLRPIIADTTGWCIIGSSFGGLMGALFTCERPHQVAMLLLLAPALTRPAFADAPPAPVATPTIIYHGTADTVIPLQPVRTLAEQVFLNLAFHAVAADHLLQTRAVWERILQDLSAELREWPAPPRASSCDCS
jgi:pimeloyl-ACP methyl ester carboxylesterase